VSLGANKGGKEMRIKIGNAVLTKFYAKNRALIRKAIFTVLIAVLSAFTLLSTTGVCAQPDASDKDFQAYFKVFKSAVIKNDKQAVASLSHFSDQGAMMGENVEAFMNNYDNIFNANVKKALKKANKIKKEADSTIVQYYFYGGRTNFNFRMINGEIKLVSINSGD
jgi:hypothetical protein